MHATLDKVLSSPKLPSLPTVAVKLLELTRDPDVSMGDIADLVQYDQALAGRILRTVNSSYYRLSQPCPSIKRALAYLGLTTVKSLVLGFSLVDVTHRCGESFDLMDYWRRCVYSAAAARRIALVTRCCDPDEAFIAALMQDVGMLAMHAVLGARYDSVVSQTKGNHLMLPHSEAESLGFTHADTGAGLGERWSLPGQIVDPIRLHHQRSTPFGEHSALVNAVILAYRISNLVSAPPGKPVLDMVSAMAQTMFRMTPEDEKTVLLSTKEDAEALSQLLEVNVGEVPDLGSLLEEADRALAEHEAHMKTEAAWLRGDINPARPADDEPEPAGVESRRGFEEALAAHFEQARSQRDPLALILVDADRFASIRSTLGPEAGEVVLRALGQRLTESVGRAGVVGRWGDEKFAILMPETTMIEAARMAERMRRHIEREHVDLHGSIEAVQVTASFGVAALEPAVAERLADAEDLIQLARKALEAAMQSGRNRVRVFRPRPAA